MWYFDARKMMETFGQPLDMINSPFAFPRLPPRANPPAGIANAGRIKDQIVHDSDMMMSRLSGYHTMFQRYASGLFNLTPNGFMPGHPMHSKMQSVDMLREENEKLRQENISLKSDLGKEKKK
jgi:hypothetical protein